MVITGGFVVLNILTAAWFPPPWRDEVAYADPAIRFVLGKGFTSAAWSSQSANSFWAANSPLHEILLIPWLKLFGVNLVAVRAFDIILCAISVLLLWAACRRNGWVVGSRWRLFMCATLLMGNGLFLVARFGRPDGITVFIAAMLALQFEKSEDVRAHIIRRCGRILTAIAIPWAGLQLVVGIGAVCAFALIFDWRKTWRFSAEVAVGIVAGFVLLLLFYSVQGQAKEFIELTLGSGHTVTGQVAQFVVIHDKSARNNISGYIMRTLMFTEAWTIDPSFICIALAMLTMWITRGAREISTPILRFGLMAGLGTPVVVLVSGKYPRYYAWMGFLVVTICAFGALGRLWHTLGAKRRILITIPVVAGCLVGAPVAFARALSGRIVNYGNLYRFVRNNVVKSDQAIVESAAYFATIGWVSETYSVEYGGGRGFRELPEQLKTAVTVLIVTPSSFETVEKKIGGRWKAGSRLVVPGTPYSNTSQQLIVYRRDAADAK
ncbi:MAG TPA: hypothetical protein VGG34_02870 [Opitutaceae bacterium]